jgi:excisionase family DNA binding protein
MMDKDYISVGEAAQLMGISRVAIFKKIKKGEIEAKKIGRNYIVNKKSLGSIYQDLTPAQKHKIEKAVEKAVREYGEAIKKLGNE